MKEEEPIETKKKGKGKGKSKSAGGKSRKGKKAAPTVEAATPGKYLICVKNEYNLMIILAIYNTVRS